MDQGEHRLLFLNYSNYYLFGRRQYGFPFLTDSIHIHIHSSPVAQSLILFHSPTHRELLSRSLNDVLPVPPLAPVILNADRLFMLAVDIATCLRQTVIVNARAMVAPPRSSLTHGRRANPVILNVHRLFTLAVDIATW